MTLIEMLENYLPLEDIHIVLVIAGLDGKGGRLIAGFDGNMCELLEDSETLKKYGNRKVDDWYIRTAKTMKGRGSNRKEVEVPTLFIRQWRVDDCENPKMRLSEGESLNG